MLHQSLLDFPLLSPAVPRFKRQWRLCERGGIFFDVELLGYGVAVNIPDSIRGQNFKHHRMRWRLRVVYPGVVCSYCGGHGPTVDHVVPRTAGGGNTLENIVPACKRCNNAKGDKPLLMFLWGRAA